VARDPYGVRPLYTIYHPEPAPHPYLSSWNETTIGFASELKMLSGFDTDKSRVECGHFTPGTYSKYVFSDKVCSEWAPMRLNQPFHHTTFSTINGLNSRSEILRGIQSHLTRAVEKRCSNTERPIACLLSGGLDSSLITALVSEHHKREGKPPVETYSIGLADSTDLKYARLVADHLGTNHTEIVLTESEFCDAIPRVIQAIESYDTTTVRASIGNFLLGEYIAKHSQAKVIFNGDGSDELMGGYLYMKHAPDAIEFDRECRRLLRDIHAFDVLRSDKSISSHGLEPRTPFLDREWTQFYLSISPLTRWRPFFSTLSYPADRIEKHLLRLAFSKEHYQPDSELRYLLPDEVLWRRKEAFSDGVSGEDRSLYQIIQEYVTSVGSISVNNIKKNPPQTAEQMYYRHLFETFYPGRGDVLPYFWMPKYVEAKDASARTLSIYEVRTTNKKNCET
jgi:asparagine synthase (glutamine-hydrolysing)